MKTRIGILAVLALVTVISGCASSQGSGTYTREQARREQTVRLGYVESVREVRLEGTRSGVGTVGGAAIGGIAGSTIGHGRGSIAAAVLGAVAGGVAGHAVEQGVTQKRGLEVTVKLDSGTMVAITQEADEAFRPGERVRILSDGATSRVTH
jgi:outer membrane lipoprotein SlyB